MIWRDLSEAKRRVRAGEVIGLPTETVYGLAAAIDQPAAIERIFLLKERPFFDPLIVHVASASDVCSVAAVIRPEEALLMERFWPGPLTLILPRRPDLNPMICSGLETVGVRCPAHPLARRVIRTSGIPLAAPSANKFGKTSPTEVAHVREFWSEAELFVLDGGPCEIGLESSVVRLAPTASGCCVEVLRPGLVTGDELAGVLRESARFGEISVRFLESAASPGHVKHHYVPAVPLVIAPADGHLGEGRLLDAIAQQLGARPQRLAELTLGKDPRVAARLLYGSMRALCEQGADMLVVFRNDGTAEEWRAIWDRLERAAAAELRF